MLSGVNNPDTVPIGKYEEFVHSFYDIDTNQYEGGKVPEPVDMQLTSRPKRAPVKKWSLEEDDILRKGIMRFLKSNKDIDYDEIVLQLPGRSVKQAKERWKNSLNPKIKKGEWSEEEIITLLDLIIAKGQNWTHIQKVLAHRSMHCIKSKGRKLLGETVNKKLSKSSKIKGVRKEWFPDEQERLLELHKIHGSDIVQICLELQTGRPTAQADRKLLTMCSCMHCTERYRQLTQAGDDFKLAWTKDKARKVKESILTDGIPAQSRGQCSSPRVAYVETKTNFAQLGNNTIRTSNDQFGFGGGNNAFQQDNNIQYKEKKFNAENTLRRYSAPLSIQQMGPLPPRDNNTTTIITRYNKRTPEETEDDEIISEVTLAKRSKTTQDFLDKLDEALGCDIDLNGLEDNLELDLSMLGDLSEKHQQDHVVALIKQTAKRANHSHTQSKLSQNIARFFADYFSPDDLQTWSGTFQEQGIEFFNPSICYVLDSITPNSDDPRYQKHYLSPESNEVTFDMFRPVGTIIVNLATRVFTDIDKPAIQIARGTMRGKHSWHFVPSRVEALLRVYYMMPRLIRTGEAWSHVRMLRCDGSEGVFLCRYKLMSNHEDAMIKFQDVSARFQDVLELPPDLW